MYILRIDYENARWNGNGRLSLNRALRKWTILPAGRASRELLRLTALACSGVRFAPHLVSAPEDLVADASLPLHLESIHARHAPYDRGADGTPIGAYGLRIDAGGRVEILEAREFRLVPERLEKYRGRFRSGNTAFFTLAYGRGPRPHRGTDDFTFGDPLFRVGRLRSLFDRAAHVTDPVAFLTRLHYRAIGKSRVPAIRTLESLCQLLEEGVGIDTRLWREKGCDFGSSWSELRAWQKAAAIPVVDATRHILDAYPHHGTPLEAPGVVIMDRPDACWADPNRAAAWLGLLDRYLPSMQLIVTVGEQARRAASKLGGKRLCLPEQAERQSPPRPRHLPMGTTLLVDIDSQLPNLALMKLSRHLKSQGRRVELARWDTRVRSADQVFASSVFFTAASQRKIELLRRRFGDAITFGGSGVDLQRRLPPEIEALPPDYTLYPELGDRALGFVTRGCPLRCSFCIVPEKEGGVRVVSDLDGLLQGRNKLILLDDNILSHPRAADLLEEMASRDIAVNFTQTMDLRMVDEVLARLIRRIRCSNTRFTRPAYYFSLNRARGLEQIRKRYDLFHFHRSDNVEFVFMYGFDTSLEEDVDRLRFLKSLPGAYVFTQLYQPTIGGPPARLEGFFNERADELIDELITINFTQNMKSMETYYRWLSRLYALTFGKLHGKLVDVIFRYNHRDRKGHYIASYRDVGGIRCIGGLLSAPPVEPTRSRSALARAEAVQGGQLNTTLSSSERRIPANAVEHVQQPPIVDHIEQPPDPARPAADHGQGGPRAVRRGAPAFDL